MSNKINIKVGDLVQVIAGVDKSEQGKVLSIDRTKQRVFVEGVNLVSRHTKPNAAHPEGGIIKQEAGLHISNVMLVSKDGPSRVGRKKNSDGKLVRYFKKTGQDIK